MTKPACETCVFWVTENSYRRDLRTCQRYPPVRGEAYMGGFSGWSRPKWPQTSSTDWCGEHQPKPSP